MLEQFLSQLEVNSAVHSFHAATRPQLPIAKYFGITDQCLVNPKIPVLGSGRESIISPSPFDSFRVAKNSQAIPRIGPDKRAWSRLLPDGRQLESYQDATVFPGEL